MWCSDPEPEDGAKRGASLNWGGGTAQPSEVSCANPARRPFVGSCHFYVAY
jgi:hypothetical protein